MAHAARSVYLLAGAALIAGCSDAADEAVGQAAEAIINGQIDTAHDAVVFVYGNMQGCSGTIVQANPSAGIGHVLTAAHCVKSAPQYVIQADDYQSIGAKIFSVLGYQAHPSYNGQLYDFAMIRIGDVVTGTPVIPAMTPAEDNLAPGTQVLHVGYGLTSYPNGQTTKRHSIAGTLAQVGSLAITYQQPNGGPCQGDSGGPNLTVGTERVAGVISAGDEGCDQAGISGRTSTVFTSFIKAYIDNAPIQPPPMTCDECRQLATTGNGKCSGEVQACVQDAQCNALLNCINGCPPGSSACYTSCTAQFGAGLPKYEAIFNCVCDVACPSVCKDAGFCNQSLSSSSAATTATSGAGGATAGVGGASAATTGAGANGAGDDGWTAGAAKDRNIQGTILTSCAAAPAGRTPAGGWLLLVAMGLAVGLVRRIY